MPTEPKKEHDVPTSPRGDDEQGVEEELAAFEAARLRVKALVKLEREGERVPGELLNLRLKYHAFAGG